MGAGAAGLAGAGLGAAAGLGRGAATGWGAGRGVVGRAEGLPFGLAEGNGGGVAAGLDAPKVGGLDRAGLEGVRVLSDGIGLREEVGGLPLVGLAFWGSSRFEVDFCSGITHTPFRTRVRLAAARAGQPKKSAVRSFAPRGVRGLFD